MRVTVEVIHRNNELYCLSVDLLYRIIRNECNTETIQEMDMWVATIACDIKDNVTKKPVLL